MKKVFGCFVVLSAVFGLNAIATPAQAYNLEGPRWPGQPAPGNCCAYVYYSNRAAFDNDYNGWQHGAASWNNSSALVFVNPSSNDDVLAQDTDDSSVTWDGLTHYQYYTGSNGKEYFISGDVTVTLNHHWTKNYGSGKTKSVAAHEFGHALGLAHHSGCYLMEHSTPTRWGTCGINTPQSDDIRGVNSLY